VTVTSLQSSHLLCGPRSEEVLNKPQVSVIIPVWNGAKTIASCLEAVAGQTIGLEKMEVIVVDNGSTDQTSEIVAAFPDVVLLTELRPGSYRARNTGLAAATGALVAFTDADCIPIPGWLEAGLEAIGKNPQIGIAAGRVELVAMDSDAASGAAFLFERFFAFRQEASAANGRSVTANWMSPRQVIDQFGGFDATLMSGGDWKLSGQISAAGYVVAYVPDMCVRHPTRSSLRELAAKRRRVAGGAWMRAGGLRRNLLGVLARNFLETCRKSVRAMSEKGWSACDRARILAVLWMLMTVGFLETVRLGLGGTPRRS
jgi:glycosyltransferase involved in cell wall biosynthesis